jgi:hypothetical protein
MEYLDQELTKFYLEDLLNSIRNKGKFVWRECDFIEVFYYDGDEITTFYQTYGDVSLQQLFGKSYSVRAIVQAYIEIYQELKSQNMDLMISGNFYTTKLGDSIMYHSTYHFNNKYNDIALSKYKVILSKLEKEE